MEKFTSMIALFFITFMLIVSPIRAEEKSDNITGQLMTVLDDTEAKKAPDHNAETVFDYAAGASVFVIGEDGDWYKVYYQGQEGYITKRDVAEEVQSQEFVDALNEEMQAVEAENKMIVEEIERQRSERKNSIVWGAIIAVLVIGIFATGIISSIKVNRKDKDNLEIIDLDGENE